MHGLDRPSREASRCPSTDYARAPISDQLPEDQRQPGADPLSDWSWLSTASLDTADDKNLLLDAKRRLDLRSRLAPREVGPQPASASGDLSASTTSTATPRDISIVSSTTASSQRRSSPKELGPETAVASGAAGWDWLEPAGGEPLESVEDNGLRAQTTTSTVEPPNRSITPPVKATAEFAQRPSSHREWDSDFAVASGGASWDWLEPAAGELESVQGHGQPAHMTASTAAPPKRSIPPATTAAEFAQRPSFHKEWGPHTAVAGGSRPGGGWTSLDREPAPREPLESFDRDRLLAKTVDWTEPAAEASDKSITGVSPLVALSKALRNPLRVTEPAPLTPGQDDTIQRMVKEVAYLDIIAEDLPEPDIAALRAPSPLSTAEPVRTPSYASIFSDKEDATDVPMTSDSIRIHSFDSTSTDSAFVADVPTAAGPSDSQVPARHSEVPWPEPDDPLPRRSADVQALNDPIPAPKLDLDEILITGLKESKQYDYVRRPPRFPEFVEWRPEKGRGGAKIPTENHTSPPPPRPKPRPFQRHPDPNFSPRPCFFDDGAPNSRLPDDSFEARRLRGTLGPQERGPRGELWYTPPHLVDPATVSDPATLLFARPTEAFKRDPARVIEWLCGIVDGSSRIHFHRGDGCPSVVWEITFPEEEVVLVYYIKMLVRYSVVRQLPTGHFVWRCYFLEGLKRLARLVRGGIYTPERQRELRRLAAHIVKTEGGSARTWFALPDRAPRRGSSWLLGFFEGCGRLRVDPDTQQAYGIITWNEPATLEGIRRVWGMGELVRRDNDLDEEDGEDEDVDEDGEDEGEDVVHKGVVEKWFGEGPLEREDETVFADSTESDLDDVSDPDAKDPLPRTDRDLDSHDREADLYPHPAASSPDTDAENPATWQLVIHGQAPTTALSLYFQTHPFKGTQAVDLVRWRRAMLFLDRGYATRGAPYRRKQVAALLDRLDSRLPPINTSPPPTPEWTGPGGESGGVLPKPRTPVVTTMKFPKLPVESLGDDGWIEQLDETRLRRTTGRLGPLRGEPGEPPRVRKVWPSKKEARRVYKLKEAEEKKKVTRRTLEGMRDWSDAEERRAWVLAAGEARGGDEDL
ncbi:hypothetical protein BDK51DRAFT_38721 [Blyttiomyces helicus]|uniref:Uncharacterized protein n=1 Tax=Blyttiomyces helicus TaxID=388810 RepID=A0A4P9W7Y0_9FUNG|nr:hypothetical protein BDK51DRAFT_38721 [Blyttiomyces helicus]|eukprot:RKO87505.1 hypothetical protein BDK51DRAFT_38721 [Blyttiomyces helicus]